MPRPSSGANLNIGQLERILMDRKQELKRLQRLRLPIQRKLDIIDRKISHIGGSMGNGRRGGGGRMRNEVSLPAAMEAVLKSAGKPLPVADIVEKVQASGYRSSSPNFRAIVNQTLIKERKRFQSAGTRGVYQLKK
jgi:hypothetical protein